VLRSQLDSHQQGSADELDKIRKTAEEENKRLTQEILLSGEEFSRKIDNLETTYKEQLEQLQGQKEREAKVGSSDVQF
jgi:type II secretory pathway component PulK